MDKTTFIAVIGGSTASPAELRATEESGRLIARKGATLVCGGLGGVMEAACRGAHQAGGLTVGVLPGENRQAANQFVDIPIVTGVGYARNIAVVKTSQAVIAIGGSYGTLTEIAYALQSGIPVIGLDTWSIYHKGKEKNPVIDAQSPAEAVDKAFEMIGGD
jgi:uncharacterized protein (TIGR00725 family)